ncbi:MAG: biopolymer transporter ExbD, partial [Sorangiineae bacterium PRO1]|nr:biopolymer transporter ExbD [Sorangiineae bacterium PRO1]
ITIPKKGNQYDFESLNTCAARLKKASPEFDDETQVFITANPGTDYQTIIQVLDAVRATPQGESLFTDANFKVPR